MRTKVLLKNLKYGFWRIDKEKNIELHQVDGADHFFRDFYFDDLVEIIVERIN